MKKQSGARWARSTELYIPSDGRRNYVIFQSDTVEGTVLMAQMRDGKVVPGDSFWELLRLTPYSTTDLREELTAGGECLLVSSLGVGLLSARYDIWMGVTVYLHISDDPLTAELFRRGIPRHYPVVWGVAEKLRKQQYNKPIAETAGKITDLQKLLEMTKGFPDPKERVLLSHVASDIRTAAALIGCSLRINELEDDVAVVCPAPRMTQGVTLFVMIWLSSVSEGREVSCAVAAASNGGEFHFRVSMAVTRETALPGGYLRALDHMMCKAALHSVTVRVTADPVINGQNDLYLISAEISFSKHPAKEPPAGLKTGNILSYAE